MNGNQRTGHGQRYELHRLHELVKSLELVLNGGVDLLTGKRLIPVSRTLPEYRDVEDLYAAVEQELAREFAEFVRALGSEAFARWRPTYLLSSLIGDCVARGREQHEGGARFEVDDLEVLMGRLAPRPADLSDEDLKSAAKYLARYYPATGPADGCL